MKPFVTINRKDFPRDQLFRFEIEAEHPDDFLNTLLNISPGLVCSAVQRQRESLRNPARTASELPATPQPPHFAAATAELFGTLKNQTFE